MRRISITVLIFIGLLLFNNAAANAHAQSTDSFPKNRATLAKMPAQVWIEFDGNLTELEGADVNTLIVKDEAGRSLHVGTARVAGARIYATVGVLDATGRVTANYRVVSEDGHPVEGSIYFTVTAESQPASPLPSHSSTVTTAPEKVEEKQISEPSTEPTISANVTKEPVTSSEKHSDHNFFQRHTTHFIEFAFGFAVIGIWFLLDRRRAK